MGKVIFAIFSTLMFFGLFAQEIPQKISCQGKLLENGNPVTGTKSISFTIDTWSETQDVSILNGIYSVQLGEIIPIPLSIVNNSDSVSFQISVEGTNLSPQTEILPLNLNLKTLR